MKIGFESTVRIAGCDFLAAMHILNAAVHSAPVLQDDVLIVTSWDDKKHTASTLHGTSQAIDLRTEPGGVAGTIRSGTIIGPWPYSDVESFDRGAEKQRWATRLRKILGTGYDVKVETDHIHVERDASKGGP